MDKKIPVLVGVAGMSAGEYFTLSLGVLTTIGRSSACEVSLQKLPRYLALSDAERASLNDLNVVSRRHLTVQVEGTVAKLENLSSSGSYCDEQRFDKGKQVDIAEVGVTLRVGPLEAFQLMLLDDDGLAELCARTRPMPANTTRVGRPEDFGRPTEKTPAIKR